MIPTLVAILKAADDDGRVCRNQDRFRASRAGLQKCHAGGKTCH
jgi:hypothetical protein